MGAGRGRLDSIRRGIRTIFFMVIMVGSLLFFSAPVFVAIADIIIPSAMLSTFACGACHLWKLDWATYSFRSSLIDIPLLSIVRSLVVTCVYSACDLPSLSQGAYLGTAVFWGLASIVFLIVKAFVFNVSDTSQTSLSVSGSLYLRPSWGVPLMFLSSGLLALGHIMVAYRTRRKARRKLLLHQGDPEAAHVCKSVFPGYQKKVPRSPTPNVGKATKVEPELKKCIVHEERDLPARMLADIDSLFMPCEGLLVHYKIVYGGSCLGPFSVSSFQGTNGGNQCTVPGRVGLENQLRFPPRGPSRSSCSNNNMTNASLYTPLLSEVNQVWNSRAHEHSDSARNPVLNLGEPDLGFAAKMSKPGRLDVKMAQQKSGCHGIILIHGFGGGVFSWRHVMGPLARQTGCAVAAFDRPGWGLTSRPLRTEWENKRLPNPYELQSQVNLLFSFCQQIGFSSVVLVGHDDGGLLALMAAERARACRDVHQLEVKGVVLVGVGLSREVVPAFARVLLHTSLGQHMLRPLLRTEISQVANRRAWYDATKLTPDVLDLYKAPLCIEGWDKALREVSKLSSRSVLSLNNASELLKVVQDLPALIIAGAEDILVSLKSAQVLSSRFSDSRIVAISGCGHLPHEECPKALLAALLPFVSKLFTASSENLTMV